MRKNFVNLFIIMIIVAFFIGCGTPAQIKKLSVKQTDYFKTAVQAAEAQSQALVSAAEEVKKEAEKKIEQIKQDNKLRFEKLAVETIPKLPDYKKERTIRRMAEEIEKISNEARDKKENLKKDFESILMQTENFRAYISKMKEIHQILDSYIQSETAYENMIKRVFNYSSEEELISDTEKLTPDISNTSNIKTN